ncbi:AAA-ATPase [Senna tora]|uniref:AAA-ATPase n=1 Tax=Senna tora TaxID=362788 RepID=A0A834XEV6_9FABA|nr:AAA-ATPase [Senna tora]
MILYNPFFLFIVTIFFLYIIRVILFKTGLMHTVKKICRSIEDKFYVYQFLRVPELYEGVQENPFYRKVSLYLHSLPSIEDSDFINLITGKKNNDIVLCLDPKQSIEDDFLGSRIFWLNEGDDKSDSNRSRTFILKIRKADKRRILRPYLQHIHTIADEIEQQGKRDLKLFMIADPIVGGKGRWRSVPFTHPSTFDTIAMESDLKHKVKSDLESFLKAKQYYNRLGRVWKRSFLLYGPSGTGKSSFVAAMANFLCYDVYDMDLSKVPSDSDLKSMLLQTTTKSIIVVEDLDRFLIANPTAVSLSGILNFMDGILNSCCTEETIMVFTMNSKEHVDPNLLRPGRVDVHIRFRLCDFPAFKTLASSYLGVKDHKLFPQVEEMFLNGASLSAAEIGELMIANRNSPSRAIKSVIFALQTDGDGRGCGENIGRQLVGNAVEGIDEPNGVLCADGFHTVKDFRKLYGFFRSKNHRKSQPFVPKR